MKNSLSLPALARDARTGIIALVLSAMSMVNLAYADNVTIPATVREMIKDDSSMAKIKDAEVALSPVGDGAYLMSLTRIPSVSDTIAGKLTDSSDIAACLADYLSFQYKKQLWSVGYSTQAIVEYATNQAERIDFFILFAEKSDKPLKDSTGKVVDSWSSKRDIHAPYGYRERCATYMKPKWLSSWETYRAPISYFDVAGERLPNRIWAFYGKAALDYLTKDERMLPIANAEVRVKAINPKLYSLKVSFDGYIDETTAMYSLMMLPSCLADYLSGKNGFAVSDFGMTDSGITKSQDKSAGGGDVRSVEYFLLLDVREDEPRPTAVGVEKITWVGGTTSVGMLRAIRANVTKGACEKLMASEFLPGR
ncbi:MAG: hypothetical protein WCV99_18820 [Sterolibacterium sp.]